MDKTAPKSKAVRMIADFDMFNRDILMNVLKQHLRQGYMLKKSAQSIGLLTFEPAPEGTSVTYAVIRSAEYSDGGRFGEPWKKCGRFGDYIIYRSFAPAQIPKPDADPAEYERSRRKTNIICGAVWLFCFIMWLADDIPPIFASARGFSEYLDFRIIRCICCAVCGITYLKQAFTKTNRKCGERGKFKYAKQYILPYILIVFMLGMLIFAIAYDREKEIPLPDSRLPFSEKFISPGSGVLDRTYAAQRYIYADKGEKILLCFLYKSNFDGLAAKVFDEIGAEHYGERYYYPYPDRYFCNYTVFEPAQASDFPHIDEIYICGEDSEYYELLYKGMIVRSGEYIFGISYEDGTYTEEEILMYLDGFFAAA